MIPCVKCHPYCAGCSFCIEACLNCPLDGCRWDEALSLPTLEREVRNREIVAMHKSGISVDVIAEGFGLTRRRVNQVVA